MVIGGTYIVLGNPIYPILSQVPWSETRWDNPETLQYLPIRIHYIQETLGSHSVVISRRSRTYRQDSIHFSLYHHSIDHRALYSGRRVALLIR
jgi:hypothetical protein